MTKEYIITALSVAIGVFVLTFLIERKLIPVLISHKVGQKILEIGPRWHKGKEGTPTMGGLSFIVSTLIVMLILFIVNWFRKENSLLIPLALTYGLAVMNGAIGYVDDYTKLIKKRNEGLKAWQKILLQIVIAAIYTVAMIKTGNLSTQLEVPFSDITVDLGWFYYIIVMVFILGIVNSANLTDGLDGLLSCVSGVISIFLIAFAFILESKGLLMLSSAMLGAVCGFLIYNFYPARVFMGDTGSLFLGGIIAGAGVMTNKLIIVLIVSVIFVIEAASDILQVSYYKITHGKRIFKMAPIHHHFEKCGWSEIKVVTVFSIITFVFCAIALGGLLVK